MAARRQSTSRKPTRQPRVGEKWQHLGNFVQARITMIGWDNYVHAEILDAIPGAMTRKSTRADFLKSWIPVEEATP